MGYVKIGGEKEVVVDFESYFSDVVTSETRLECFIQVVGDKVGCNGSF